MAVWPDSHPEVKFGKTGILLINLGTPKGTDYWNMRAYLRQFLSDTRVIEVPRVIWLPILYLIILTFRPSKSGRAYAKIWGKNNESPCLPTLGLKPKNFLNALLQSKLSWILR